MVKSNNKDPLLSLHAGCWPCLRSVLTTHDQLSLYCIIFIHDVYLAERITGSPAEAQ